MRRRFFGHNLLGAILSLLSSSFLIFSSFFWFPSRRSSRSTRTGSEAQHACLPFCVPSLGVFFYTGSSLFFAGGCPRPLWISLLEDSSFCCLSAIMRGAFPTRPLFTVLFMDFSNPLLCVETLTRRRPCGLPPRGSASFFCSLFLTRPHFHNFFFPKLSIPL